MNPARFSLTSDQLELLLAFATNEGLEKLAFTMGRDPSVISRSLQRIAEQYPVLAKVKGRWELTPLGRQINELTKKFIDSQSQLLPHEKSNSLKKDSLKFSTNNSVLVVINAQAGLLDATQEGRSNSEAEINIAKLLKFWRKNKMPVIHIKHVSDNPSSIFYRMSASCDFLASCSPVENELVLEKTKSSGFTGTDLEKSFKSLQAENLVLVGFTANECIDATAKDAAALDISTIVVGDATAMFDLRAPDGKLIKADRIHRLTLANIGAFYAKVAQTADVLK